MHIQRTVATLAFLSVASFAAAQQGGGGERPRTAPPPTPEAFADRMMERDENGDGKLSREELPGQFADRLFANNDANADGFLDRTELLQAAESLGQQGFGRRPAGERPGAAVEGERGAAGQVDFHDAMSRAGRALRQLRRSSFDAASREADLRLIQSLQENLLAAKSQAAGVPMAPQAKARYGEDADTYKTEFRQQLIQSLMESLALEDAVVNGESAAAKESLEHLLEVQRAAHEAFQPEEDEDEDEEGAEEARPAAPAQPDSRTRAPGRGNSGGGGG